MTGLMEFYKTFDEDPNKYDAKDKMLHGSQYAKAKKLIDSNLVIDNKDGTYTIKPIPNYNRTTYTIADGKCSCQFNQKGLECSHLKAVKMLKQKARI
jgi:hypothetical protein